MDTLTGEPVLTISVSHWQQMQADVNARAPVEACGLLAGKNGIVQRVYPITNALSSKTRFRMAAQEQINAFLEIDTLNLELLAIYHSHPNGSPMPSATDLVEFTYPGVLYLIWYPHDQEWRCGCFLIEGQHFRTGKVIVEPGE